MIEIASTYAVFQWEAPESPNGVIRRYILSLTDSRDSSAVSVNITDASELTANVTGLDPFIQYWVMIFAETTEVGEGSTNFSFITHQDSKITSIPAPSSAENLTVAYNTTNIFVTWSTPVYPNGLVNYTIVVKERDLLDDSGAPPTIIEQEITKELELVVDYVVNAHHEYVVSVTSQTGAGMGESVMEIFVTTEDGK